MGYRRVGRLPLAGAALIAAALALVPYLVRAYGRSFRELGPLVRSLSSTTFEDRRRAAYGDCSDYGYGYLLGVLGHLEDARHRPIVRYPEWNRSWQLLVPGERNVIDERILVAIGVAEDHYRPERIASATLRDERTEGDWLVGRWIFQTTWDYDLLVAFQVELQAPTRSAVNEYQLTVLDSPTRAAVLGRAEASVPAGQARFELPLRPPPRSFSIHRGSSDFLVEVRRRADAPALAALAPVGIRIDASDYVVVHRRGACSTAIRRDALEGALAEPSSPWARMVEGLRHGG